MKDEVIGSIPISGSVLTDKAFSRRVEKLFKQLKSREYGTNQGYNGEDEVFCMQSYYALYQAE